MFGFFKKLKPKLPSNSAFIVSYKYLHPCIVIAPSSKSAKYKFLIHKDLDNVNYVNIEKELPNEIYFFSANKANLKAFVVEYRESNKIKSALVITETESGMFAGFERLFEKRFIINYHQFNYKVII